MSGLLCAQLAVLTAVLYWSSGVQVTTGAELYVATTGSLNSTCTCEKKTPCKTIQQALNISKPNDTILIDGSGQSYIMDKNVTVNHTLTFKPWGDKPPTIECKIVQDPCTVMVKVINASDEVIMQSINVRGCYLCIHQGTLTHSQSTYSAQSTIALCSGEDKTVTGLDLNHVNLEQSTLMLTNSCVPTIQASSGGQSLAVDMTDVSFRGMSKLVTDGPISEVRISMNRVKFLGIQTALELGGFSHLQLDMNNSAIRNMNSTTTGFSINVREKATMDISILNSIFHNNTCYKGGVLRIIGTNSGNIDATIINSTFEENNSTTSGTAMYIDLGNSSDNTASQHKFKMTNCTFVRNTNVESAGAVYVNGANMTITGSTFKYNEVAAHISVASNTDERKGSGGALYVLKSSVLHIDRCSFVNNSANWFGGALAGPGDMILTNSYFENAPNGIHSSQGEIWFLMGNVKLDNLTINATYTTNNIAILWYSSDTSILEGIGDGQVQFSCPAGSQFRNETLLQHVHESNAYKGLFYFCDTCPDNKYSMQHGYLNGSIETRHSNWSEDFTCLNCEYGAECHHGKIYSQLTFWGHVHKEHVNLIHCLEGYCCGDDVCESYDTCGPNRTGVLCGQCQEGMSEILWGTECRPNEQCTDSWYITFDLMITIFYLLFFLYEIEIISFVLRNIFWMKVSHKDDAAIISYIKIIFYFYQTVDLLRVQDNSAEEMIGVAIEPFIVYLLTFQPVAAIFGICPFPDMTPVTKNLVKRSIFLYLILFLGIIAAVYFAYKHWQDSDRYESNYVSLNVSPEENLPTYVAPSFKSRIAVTFVNLFLYNHVTIANLTFLLLACIPLGSTYVLYIDGNVTCMQPWQAVFVILAVVHVIPFFAAVIVSRHLLDFRKVSLLEFFMSYVLPLPMLLFWLGKWLYARYKGDTRRIEDADDDPLLSMDQNSDEEEKDLVIKEILLVIEEPYIKDSPQESSTKYWEGILMFRRLFLVVMDNFILQEVLCLTLQTVACLGFLLWHVQVKPFGASSANYMEMGSLTILTIIGICHIIQASFISTGHIPTGPIKTQIFVTDWIEWVLINGFLFAFILAVVITVVIRIGQLILWSFRRAKAKFFQKDPIQPDPVRQNGARPGSRFGRNGGLSISADLVEEAPNSHDSLSS